MNEPQSSHRPFLIDALHIFALWGFAVAQPIYDLLGQNAEFFVAHRLGTWGIVGFAAVLSLGVPLLLVGIEALIRPIAPRVQRLVHLIFVCLLIAATFAPLLNRVPALTGYTPSVLALLAAAGMTALYAAFNGLRTFLTVLSPGALVFPALFLFLSPVSGLLFPSAAKQEAAAAVTRSVPIVFVIFDEFEAGALLDSDRAVDPVRFPNFAALARESVWFPHATSAWAETKRAVPAILTGQFPSDAKAVPSLQSHPNNLFTWLKDSYRFNVTETLTNLCPTDLCRTEQDSQVDGELLLSDLSILYLHVILPRSLSKELLPPMDTGWKGFTKAGEGDHDDPKPAGNPKGVSAYRDRGERFLSFVESIDGGEPRTLNFLHILLPHVNYTYLPSGSTYLGGDTEGLLERELPDKAWVEDDLLSNLAYQRFLLQAGYVDKLLGQLIERLKEKGVYDRALVIVTSDHGKSFRPGQPKRLLTRENASDLLQVPLFVKLPGQSGGRTDERYVSTVDILPTIADVIGADLPWQTDGRSLVDPDYKGRDVIELKPLDEHRATGRYVTAQLASYPRLPWKLKTFGSRTPLSTLQIQGRYSELVGRSVDELPVAEGSGIRMKSDQFGSFANVRPGITPAHLRGALQDSRNGTPLSSDPRNVAVAVNGVVQAVTRTVSWLGNPAYVSVMIPEPAFKTGRNAVELFTIQDRPDGATLAPIAVPDHEVFRIAKNEAGQEILKSEEGKVIPIGESSAHGHLDAIGSDAGSYSFLGWAVDVESSSPAPSVLLFADGKQVYAATPNMARADLVKHFKAENVRNSGFRFSIDKASIEPGPAVRMFVVGKSGTAAEIVIIAGQWR